MDLGHAFTLQAAACRQLGSPVYGTILERCARDHFEQGPVHDVVPRWDRDPVADAVALRLAGGVHRIVLSGRAPDLAAHYPTVGGEPDPESCGDAFIATVAANVDELRIAMLRPPQTNEVGRSAVLLGGLLEIVRLTDMPFRLCEIGSSAGLNLLLDRYRYELGGQQWGDPQATTVIQSVWTGSTPDTTRRIGVVTRIGCDPDPLDVTSDDDRLTLLSYVWPDQPTRFERSRSALDTARREPPVIARMGGADWLERILAVGHPAAVTVVMHSVVMQYVTRQERHRILQVVRNAGRAATPDAPVAWLRMEPGRRRFELRLSLWPHGIDLVLAATHPHGSYTEWFVGIDAG